MEKDITELTKEELLNPGFIPSLFENYTEKDGREEVLKEVLEQGKTYHIVRELNNSIKKCKQERQEINGQVFNFLIFNKVGDPEVSIQNYLNIFENDPNIYNNIKYDSLARDTVKLVDGKWVHWTDSDDADLERYVENTYHISNSDKYVKGFLCYTEKHSENPLQKLIESGEWDGVPRIDRFLIKWMHCEDERYSEEVSRMIFYGGINRLYNPGCKFDYMPIFIGSQGTYKSTLVKWLALDEKYFREVSTIEGKDGMEVLTGAWICEFGELLAMVRTREVEAMKSYISRTTDVFRRSYDRRVSHVERTCIFIGTTNETEFLVDKTGNRRYLPIKLNAEVGEFAGKEEEIKHEILMCWREALYLYKNNKTYLTIPLDIYNIVTERQNQVVEDDPKVGVIKEYLDSKPVGYKVCCLELFTQCMNNLKKNYDRSASRDIGRILNMFPEWKRSDTVTRLPDYGVQKYWERIK